MAPGRTREQFLSLALPLACQLTLNKSLHFLTLQLFSLQNRGNNCHLPLGETPCHLVKFAPTELFTNWCAAGKHNSKRSTATPSHPYAEPQTPRTTLQPPSIHVKPSHCSAAVTVILPSVALSSLAFFPPLLWISSGSINCSFLEQLPHPYAHPQSCHWETTLSN